MRGRAPGARATSSAVRRSAGFDANQARRQFLEECQHVSTLQLASEHDIAFHINTVNLKYRLRDIETDCRDRLHDLAPPNRGRLKSTHIHGAHAPVEEPSTASTTDLASSKCQSAQVDQCAAAAVSCRTWAMILATSSANFGPSSRISENSASEMRSRKPVLKLGHSRPSEGFRTALSTAPPSLARAIDRHASIIGAPQGVLSSPADTQVS